MSRKKTSRCHITTHKPESPPPAGYDSWEAFRADVWNAGLEQPGTRVFKVVGDELHEVTKEEAVIGPHREEAGGSDAACATTPRPVKGNVDPADDSTRDGARHLTPPSTQEAAPHRASPCGGDELDPTQTCPADLHAGAEESDPWFWEGRLRTEIEMATIVYEVMCKALRFPVVAGCDLGWMGTGGKFPYDVARLIIQEGPIALEELLCYDNKAVCWYLSAMADTYVHFGPERAHSVRERLRREALEAIEQGIDNSVQ